MDFVRHYVSPLGGITLASDGMALTGLWFDGQIHFAETISDMHEERDLPVFVRTSEWLDIYFGGAQPGFMPELNIRATPFRRAVYDILMTVPYGHTVTYKDIADILIRRQGLSGMSPQAVGGAVGHNPVSLIIPCHRVVGTDGSLTGYAGGLDRKLSLLRLENTDMTGLFVPAKKQR